MRTVEVLVGIICLLAVVSAITLACSAQTATHPEGKTGYPAPFKTPREVCFNGVVYYEFDGPTVTYAPKLHTFEDGVAYIHNPAEKCRQ